MKRRNFLHQSLGVGLGLQMMPTVALQMLIEGRYSQLLAQQSPTPPRALIDFSILGGAPGWFFHLPLNPFNTGNFMPNISAANYFDDRGNPIYKTTPITVSSKTFHMPHLWSATIPTTTGVQVPMAELMTNMFFLRGFFNSRDDHAINMHQMFRPDASQRSIHGIIADAMPSSQAPIPAVSLDHYSSSVYRSRSIGLKAMDFGSLANSTVLTDLLSPFRAEANIQSLLGKKELYQGAFSNALNALKQDALQKNQKNEAAFSALSSAEALIKRDFGNLRDVYLGLYNKYLNLINSCRNLTSILPHPISPTQGSSWRNINASKTTIDDLRNITTVSSALGNLANNFAVTEFLIKENLSCSILASIMNISGLEIPINDGTPIRNILFDQHFLGVGLSVAGNTFAFRAIAACLYELIRVLKAQGKFDETVIRLSSEFSRSPRAFDSNDPSQTGTGSDHGWQANHYALLSGAFKTPQVVGNILINSSPAQQGSSAPQPYEGTWGVGAKIQHDGANAPLNWGHAASTLATALRAASPMPNFRGVLSEHPSLGLIPIIGDGENNES